MSRYQGVYISSGRDSSKQRHATGPARRGYVPSGLPHLAMSVLLALTITFNPLQGNSAFSSEVGGASPQGSSSSDSSGGSSGQASVAGSDSSGQTAATGGASTGQSAAQSGTSSKQTSTSSSGSPSGSAVGSSAPSAPISNPPSGDQANVPSGGSNGALNAGQQSGTSSSSPSTDAKSASSSGGTAASTGTDGTKANSTDNQSTTVAAQSDAAAAPVVNGNSNATTQTQATTTSASDAHPSTAATGKMSTASSPTTPPIAAAASPVATTQAEQSSGAQTGDASAKVGQVDSTLINTQISAGITAGGTGAVSVQNNSSVEIARAGSASADSGMSIAFTPVPSPQSSSQSGQTVATSGSASAVGVKAQNEVNNTALALVQVGGESAGNVTIQSSNSVNIVESGTADARSGSSLSMPAASSPYVPSPAPSPAATPAVTGAAHSDPVSTVGIAAQNSYAASSTIVATPPATSKTPIVIHDSQGVAMETNGWAVAKSDGVCAGNGCPTAVPTQPISTPNPSITTTGVTATPVPTVKAEGIAGSQATTSTAISPTPPLGTVESTPGSTSASSTSTSGPANQDQPGDRPASYQASSGSAEATGLIARNFVNTDADVKIAVGGENRGIITVLIETITEIFNLGNAKASSGSATSSNGVASSSSSTEQPATMDAKSGAVEATGARVENQVDMSSKATVKVAGDNWNPINLFLELFATITNRAFGWAASGDARASGGAANSDQASVGNGSSAASGSAQATGLEAQNRFNLLASALVDIEGSNYADVNVWIRFHTRIENEGHAVADSGKVESEGVKTAEAVGEAGTQASVGAIDSALGANKLSSGSDPSVGSIIAKSGDATASGNSSTITFLSTQHSTANGSDWSIPTPVSSVAAAGSSAVVPVPTRPVGTVEDGGSNGVGWVTSRSGNATSGGWESNTLVVNSQLSLCSNPGSEQCRATNVDDYRDIAQSESRATSGFTGVNATPTPTPLPTAKPETSDGAQVSAQACSVDPGNAASISDTKETIVGVRSSAGGSYPPTQYVVEVKLPSRWPGIEQPPMPEQRLSLPHQPPSRAPFAGSANVSMAMNEEVGNVPGSTVSLDPQPVWPDYLIPPMPGQTVSGSLPFGPPRLESGEGPTPLQPLLYGVAGMFVVVAAAVTRRSSRMWLAVRMRQSLAAVRIFMSLVLYLN